jgi:glucosamine--fructose-6-phosphate aminotransferase (isomerizing)
LAGIQARADIASEFRYSDPLVGSEDLLIAISQSGETTDTLGALRVGLGKGTRSLGVVNVVGSSVARETGDVLYTRAGPEIAVASTKAYTTQLVVLTLAAIELARMRGRMGDEEAGAALRAMGQLPAQAAAVLEQLAGGIEAYARQLALSHDAFFIGRGLDYAVCLEAQLKLKEISYLHAEAYPAGELKHGTLALISEGTPVVAVVSQPAVAEKTVSNIREVAARGGDVTAFVREDLVEMVTPHVSRVFALPVTLPWLQPVLAAIPLQLLAYYTAVARGADVDKPRNLAKSVTVE